MSLSTFQKDPKAKYLAEQFQKTITIALEKAAGHLTDPAHFPIPADPQTLEATLHALLVALPKKRRDQFTAKYKAGAAFSAQKRNQLYGELGRIDIRSKMPISDQLKNIVIPANKKISAEDLERFHTHFPAITSKTGGKRIKQPSAVVTPGGKLAFSLLDLTCDKTSEVRRDEISLAGFATDSLGGTLDKAPFFIGEFKKGQTIPLDPVTGLLFSFDINPASPGIVFPLGTTVGLFLVEKDLLHNQDLSNKLSRIFYALTGVMGVVNGVLSGLAIAGGPFSLPVWITCMAIGLTFAIFANNIIPLITDDISTAGVDLLVLEAPTNIGERFDRVLNFELYNQNLGLLDGKPGRYRANIRWEVF